MDQREIEMEGGMTFEFEVQEQEPVTLILYEDGEDYEYFRMMISGPIQLLDLHGDESAQVVQNEPQKLWLMDDLSEDLKSCFVYSLGHGLSPRQINYCVEKFSNLILALFDRESPYTIVVNNFSVKLRRFVFKIQRKGFWRSPYLARALAEPREERRRCCRIYVDALERFEHEKYVVEEDDEECPICFGRFGRGSEAARLACRHCFHRRCIARWLSMNYTCPCCRAGLVPDSDTDSDDDGDSPRPCLYPPHGILLDLHVTN